MGLQNNLQSNLKNLLPVSKASEVTDEGRREAIKKLGIFGAYTAPALIVLLRSGKAVAQSGQHGGGHGGGHED